MRSNLLRLTAVSVFALVAVLLTGCDDQEARSNAESARKTADTLKGEVEKLQAELADLKKQVGGMRTALEEKIGERMDSIAKSVSGVEEKLLAEVGKRTSETGERTGKLIEDADARVKSKLDSYMKEDLAKHFQKIYADIEENHKQLIGYMDQQLKELYPYAYQPKRLEGPNPPTPPTP